MAVERVTVPSYCRRPRQHPVSLILVHSTRGPTTMALQYSATVGWFKRGSGGSAGVGWGANSDALIGAGGEVAEFGDWRTTRANWSAGFGGSGPPTEHGADEHALSIELAQPTNADAYTEACIAAFIAYVRPIMAEFGIPAVRIPFWAQLTSAVVPRGLIGHQDTANGKRTGKSDPGDVFPWASVLLELAAPAPARGLDMTVVGTRVERESKYIGYDRTRPAADGSVGSEVHEVREYWYRSAP